MLSERHEAFRYEFSPPLQCQFNIALENEPDTASHFGDAEIHNISLNGLMFKTSLNIPRGWDSIRVTVKFSLIDMEFVVLGHFRWNEIVTGNYFYGIQLENDDELNKKIINQLKKLSRIKHNMPL